MYFDMMHPRLTRGVYRSVRECLSVDQRMIRQMDHLGLVRVLDDVRQTAARSSSNGLKITVVVNVGALATVAGFSLGHAKVGVTDRVGKIADIIGVIVAAVLRIVGKPKRP